MTYIEPKCKECGKEMTLDDVDYRFKGCQDEYWVCEKCQSALIVKVRYGKVCKIEYFPPEDNKKWH